MAQTLPETWISGGLNPALSATAGSAAPGKSLSKRAVQFFSSRVESIASSNPSGLPPIMQFVMHAIAWCRTKLKGGVSVASPLRLVSQLPLGGKRSLALIEADGLRFLIGGGADSVTVIVPVSGTAFVSQQDAANIRRLDLEKQAEAVRER